MTEKSDTALLQSFLAGRSHACPVCGYDLRDLQSDRCPECGKILRLTITQDKPVRAPFVIGLIAFAAPLGASICAISGVFYWRMTRYEWADLMRPLIANSVTLVLAIAALLIWLRFAPRLRRQSPGRQWAWALFACTLTLIGHVIFLLIVW
jgi:uncharacterized protein (DUF983 family)